MFKEKHEFDKVLLNEMKIKQSKLNKCQHLLKQILLNFVFLWVLFQYSYLNINANAYNYQNQIKTKFSSYKNVIFKHFNKINSGLNLSFKSILFLKVKTINELYKWISNDFINEIKSDDFKSEVNFTSILIGYPIIRQLRIKPSKF